MIQQKLTKTKTKMIFITKISLGHNSLPSERYGLARIEKLRYITM